MYLFPEFPKGLYYKTGQGHCNGLINYSGSSNNRNCQFRESDNQSKIKYTPDDIIGYGFLNDKYYESRKIVKEDQTSESVFLEVVVKGLVSLYKYDKIFYIGKADTAFYKVSNETIKSSIDGQEMATSSVRYIIVPIGNVLNAVFEFRGEKIDGISTGAFLPTSKSSVTGIQFVLGVATK